MTSGGHQRQRGPGPAEPGGWSTPTEEPAPPLASPRASRSAPVRSVACSHIAVRLRQPAGTPVTARDRTVDRVMAHTPSIAWIGDVPENLDQGLARQGVRGGR